MAIFIRHFVDHMVKKWAGALSVLTFEFGEGVKEPLLRLYPLLETCGSPFDFYASRMAYVRSRIFHYRRRGGVSNWVVLFSFDRNATPRKIVVKAFCLFRDVIFFRFSLEFLNPAPSVLSPGIQCQETLFPIDECCPGRSDGPL